MASRLPRRTKDGGIRAGLTGISPAMRLIVVASVLLAACWMSFQLDQVTSDGLRSWDPPGDLAKAIALSEAFAHGFGAATILIAAWLVATTHRKQLLLAIIITATSGIVANVLKSTVVRVRPFAVGLRVAGRDSSPLVTAAPGGTVTSDPQRPEVPQTIWDARQRSFPSGHAATAWGLAIGLSLVFPRGSILFVILALLASLQRIISGAHFVSDVLAGASIACCCAALVLSLPPCKKLLASPIASRTDEA